MSGRASIPNYVYSRLPTTDHIRLLKLQPKDASGTLKISLETFHHLSCPSYTAISYTWGTNQLHNAVTIITKAWFSSTQSQLKIGNQAHDVLTALQSSTARWLWLDAICIDQEHVPERNQQVKLMAMIYNNATNVVAWLGQEDDDRRAVHQSMEIAFNYMSAGLRHAVSLCENVEPEQATDEMYVVNANVPIVPWRARGDDQGQHIHKPWDTDEDREHFNVFCSRHYWTRKWIIQELVIPRRVTLQYGYLSMPMVVVEDFFHYWSPDVELHITRLAIHCFYYRKRLENPDSMYAQFPGSLIVLIATYPDSECREPIDHVYALASLASYRHLLPIKYDASPARQLTDTLRYIHEVEQLEQIYLFKWAAKLCRLIKLDPMKIDDQPHIFSFQLSHAGHAKLKAESPWAEACRKLVRPVRSIRQLHYTNLARMADDPNVRVSRLQAVAGLAEWTQPANLNFFKLDDHVWGLGDVIEEGDSILVPGESCVGLVVRVADNRYDFVGCVFLFEGDDKSTAPLSPKPHYAAITYGTHNPLIRIVLQATNLLELAAIIGELDAIRKF